jgi:short-subunit dehydrogenase
MGTLYHSSKFAVEGVSEALSYGLAGISVKVKLIEPGIINTNFGTTSFDLNMDESLTEYKPFLDKTMVAMQGAATQASEPILVS